MSSSTVRTVAAAVIFTAFFGLSVAPASAQPHEARTAAQAQTLFERLWQWIEAFWPSGGTVQRMQDNSTWTGGTEGTDQAGLRRGMTIDPNG